MKIKRTFIQGLTAIGLILGLTAFTIADAADHNLDKATHELVIQDNGAITATITDASTGDPLTGAEVRLEGEDISEMTDNSGNVTFSDLESGEYKLTVYAEGYASAEVTVEVDEDTAEIRIELDHDTD